MARSAPVSVPGAPADTAADLPAATGADAATAASVDPRDAEIAKLRAELAAANAPARPAMVMEADGPNVRRHMAESKHLHLTSAELHEQVMSGKVKLTEHHVLCKDGWYVNPAAQKQANG